MKYEVKELNHIPCGRKIYYFDEVDIDTANDSGPFSKAGLNAMTLLAFKILKPMVAFYHQKWDRPEILTIEPRLNMLKLTFEWIINDGR